MVGAPPREPRGLEPTRTKVSCYLGNDPGSWRKEIPTYAQVSLGEVTNGIDLVVRAYGRTVEKVFSVHPGGKVATLVLKIEGAQGLEVNEQVELEVATGLGKARFSRPVAYQEKEGKKEFVSAAYRVLDKQTYGFDVSAYDSSRPLVIDPLLASTYLGGVGNEWGRAMALDGAGNVYVAGGTMSAGFPTTPGAYDTSYGSPEDVSVTKLDPNLTEVLASTYIGGSGSYSFYGADVGMALSIDSEGNVYVAGLTYSSNFPTTVGAYDRSWNGYFDTFVCVLDADLTTLLASTFLGGGQNEFDPQLAVNGDGDVFVSGWTYSDNFPTSEGAYDTSFGGDPEGYVARLNGTLTSLSASTFLGGVGGERIGAMTLDASGNVYVAGVTWNSPDFLVTQGAYNTTYEDGIAFVSKLDVTLTTLLASSFSRDRVSSGHGNCRRRRYLPRRNELLWKRTAELSHHSRGLRYLGQWWAGGILVEDGPRLDRAPGLYLSWRLGRR